MSQCSGRNMGCEVRWMLSKSDLILFIHPLLSLFSGSNFACSYQLPSVIPQALKFCILQHSCLQSLCSSRTIFVCQTAWVLGPQPHPGSTIYTVIVGKLAHPSDRAPSCKMVTVIVVFYTGIYTYIHILIVTVYTYGC